MNRILALFRERDTRDELGIGIIRDLVADELFPGTSTIQTRLRYMLFVPWIYQRLEKKHPDRKAFAEEARRLEVAIVKALATSDDTVGVFGKRAGGGLKRLPSSVYWAGLGMWEIRRFQGSQESYHSAIEDICRQRTTRSRSEDSARRRGEWLQSLDRDALGCWTLDWVEQLAATHQQVVSRPTLGFCKKWLELVCSKGDGIFDDAEARSLIRTREMRLKGGRSRFTNPRALDQ